MTVDPRIQAALDAPMKGASLDLVRPTAAELWMKKGFAAQPGSGPKGETCGTCAYRWLLELGYRSVSKCKLTRLTKSKHSDVSKRSPACVRWERAA
jgi:hypothetical protein